MQEVLDTRVECVFLSEWALRGGSEMITSSLARTLQSRKRDGKFAARLKGE